LGGAVSECYSATDANILGVLSSDVAWDLSGEGAMLKAADPGIHHYSLEVAKDAPFALSIDASAVLQEPSKTFDLPQDMNEPVSEKNPISGYHTITYHQPALYGPEIDWVLRKTGDFPAEITRSDAGGFTITGTFTSYSRSLEIAIVLRVAYDSAEYDEAMRPTSESKDVVESDSHSGTICIQPGG
jgi:hypothetical protein